MTLQALEAAVAEAVGRAAQELMLRGCAALEAHLFQQGRLHRNKRRPRDLLTRFGWVRLERWHAREDATGRYQY